MLDHLLLTLNDCAWAYNQTENKYAFISPLVHQFLGVHPDELKADNSRWYKNVEKDDLDHIIEAGKILQTDHYIERHYRIKLDGATRWMHEKLSRFTDKTTGHDIVLGVIKDVSDRHVINIHLKNSLGDFSVLFEKNNNPMWIYEVPSLRILKVNEAAIEHYGYTEEEFLSFTIRDIRPKIDLAKFNEYIFRKGIARGALKGFNTGGIWKHVNHNGDLIYAEITGYEVKYNNAACRIVVASDVTERVLYEQERDGMKQMDTSE